MTDQDPTEARRALGARLRDLRARRFRSGSEMARSLGWPQPRLSKIENGRRLPTQTELEGWIEATGATPEEAEQVRDLLGPARLSYRCRPTRG